MPAEIRGEAAFKDIKDLGGLAKSYLHAHKLVGLDKATLVALPGPDDKDGWAALHTRLGRPEKVDGYAVPKPASGAYTEGDLAFQKTILPVLHEAGVTQRQLDAIAPKWNEIQAGLQKQAEDAAAAEQGQSLQTLKTEFGAAFDAKMETAKKALAHYASPDLVAYLEKTKLGDNPAMVRLFAKLGDQLREDGVLGRAEGAAGVLSPAEAKQQINGLRQDKGFMEAYQNKRSPGHADAVAKMERFYQMAYPASVG